MKKALILGITGMDGSYLAEILLEQGYRVHGLYRRSSTGNLSNISHIIDKITLHKGDVTDDTSLLRIIGSTVFDEIYHEADQDNVDWSYNTVGQSMDVTVGSVGRVLEICRMLQQRAKIFIPVSAMMFGNAPSPQNEKTPFSPQSPYACAKVGAYYLAQHYRREHGMWVNTAILYNHDSPRRNGDYLLHKICKGAIRISKGLQDSLTLGNLSTIVDIGYAKEYMRGVYDLMQLEDSPDDYVIGTGKRVSIRTIVTYVFGKFEMSIEDHVIQDPSFRQGSSTELVADNFKSVSRFGFCPTSTAIELVDMLLEKYEEVTA